MFIIIWTYEVSDEKRAAFEAAYGAGGLWGTFFRGGDGYRGTELLRSATNRYVTLDRWDSKAAYEAFTAREHARYTDIDRRCGELTERERYVGAFETL